MTPPRKRGLGRGLDALLEEGERPGVRELPVGRLRPNRYQPRSQFNDTGIDELAESIRNQGVVQPLIVTPDQDDSYTIVAGERRWRAAQRAGLQAVPVVVREISGPQELLELALVENLQREDLNPIEEAEAYQALQTNFQLSQDDVARRVGKARSTVTNSLRLLKLPVPVRDLLRDGRLTAGQARPLLALETEERQVELAQRALRDRLSARDLERLATRKKKGSGQEKAVPPVEVHAAAAQEKLTRHLQTKVEIKRRGKKGEIRISFHSEEELMRLFDLLMGRGE